MQFSILLCIIFQSNILALKFDEKCTTTDGKRGVCVHLTNCAFAMKLIENRQSPTLCNKGTEANFNALVCCVDEIEEDVSGSISEKMCRSYYPQFYDPSYEVPFKIQVVGGRKSLAQEYPHMALIGYDEEQPITWICGGSLISDKFVITAGHCVVNRYGSPTIVRLGELDTANETEDANPQDFHIKNIFVHPGYHPQSAYHDIALLELEKKVTFSDYITPACLYQSRVTSDIPFVIGTGWGLTEFAGQRSSHLMTVNLKTVSHQKCKNIFKTSNAKLSRGIVEDVQICAGGNEGKDTCGGDSGGPIQIIRPESLKKLGVEKRVYDLIGLTSFGIGCGIGDLPGVYTRIHFYLDWIEKTIWSYDV